jgi:hypothetical protein
MKIDPYLVDGGKIELYVRNLELVLISETIEYWQEDGTRRVDRRLRVE